MPPTTPPTTPSTTRSTTPWTPPAKVSAVLERAADEGTGHLSVSMYDTVGRESLRLREPVQDIGNPLAWLREEVGTMTWEFSHKYTHLRVRLWGVGGRPITGAKFKLPSKFEVANPAEPVRPPPPPAPAGHTPSVPPGLSPASVRPGPPPASNGWAKSAGNGSSRGASPRVGIYLPTRLELLMQQNASLRSALKESLLREKELQKALRALHGAQVERLAYAVALLGEDGRGRYAGGAR